MEHEPLDAGSAAEVEGTSVLSTRRIFVLEMLGYALVSRVLLATAGWYFSWAVTPNWPEFIRGNRLVFPWAQWDGYHYARIAQQGYGNVEDPGISAFFPVFPMIMRIFGIPFGAQSIQDYQVIGVIVGWIIFLACTIVSANMFLDYFEGPLARTMMIFWLFSPFAFFFSTAYTEGLFFLEVALCFILLRKKRFWAAAVVVAFATATRLTGVALILSVVIVAWRQRESLLRIATYCVVAASGLVSFMLHTYIVRDDPIAFLHAQSGWGGFEVRAGTYYRGLIYLKHQFIFADVGNSIMLLNMCLYGLALILLLIGFKRIPLEISAFSAAVLIQSFVSVQSMGRYVLPALTTYIVAAMLLHRAPRHQYWIGLVVSSSLISMVTLFLLFAHGAWVV